MTQTQEPGLDWSSLEAVNADLQRQPHLFLRLAENALTVAPSLRDHFFHVLRKNGRN